MNDSHKIFVTRPFLPPLSEFTQYLEKIWDNKWLTNQGPYHQELETELCEYLGVEYLSLFANGTIALVTALQALKISGEVITTPYSFVATAHSLFWNNITPVFVDIDPETCNIDSNKIETAITPKTTAIMPVHCYGTPCDVGSIQHIADTYGLKVIYDAAHAFGVQINSKSLLEYGDLSVLSFHATKVFNTFEGGAIICPDLETKMRIDYLKNFGFAGETKVVALGINGKMNEIQAAFGLLHLKYIDEVIKKRSEIDTLYRKLLADTPGINCFSVGVSNTSNNYSYFPIFVNQKEYGKSRDELYNKLKENNIFGRRYFYPLISHFPIYSGLESSISSNLTVAEKIAKEVICLPIYPDLTNSDVNKISSILCE